ncbi:MAG: hypothetical protein IVW54_09215 [Candidatus Binataceae bacterium]|nr:hypothetical protein [Candidatus Binataceae bacterium]
MADCSMMQKESRRGDEKEIFPQDVCEKVFAAGLINSTKHFISNGLRAEWHVTFKSSRPRQLWAGR